MRILFFDGYCVICNRLVDWLMKNEKDSRLYLASLQGETAKKMIPEYVNESGDFSTVIYWRAGVVLKRSDAIIYALYDRGRWWKVFKLVLFIPRVIRDFCYNFVARNRYRLFEKRAVCRVPLEHERVRLLP